MKSTRVGVLALPAILGITSTCAQIVLIRELFVVFTGNELIFSASLSIWLISVSIGALISGHIVKGKSHDRILPQSLSFAFILPLAEAICIRFVNRFLIGFGEIPSPLIIILLSAIGLSLTGFGFGLLFVVSTSVLQSFGYRQPIGVAYGFEAFGAGVVGILLSFLLLEEINPISILAGVSLACTIAVLVLTSKSLRSIRSNNLIGLIVALLIVTIFGRNVDIATRRWQWRPLKLISTVDTRYGNITVLVREQIFDFYESGLLSFSAPDLLSAEETVHIPLLMHPSPKQVLIIGGSATGVIGEIEKHRSIKCVDYVELDPVLLEIAGKLLPRGWLSSSRLIARSIYGDGRRYVYDTDENYDVVIVNVGEPLNLYTSRYYTKEFFKKVGSILRPEGIIALRISTEGAYLGGYRAKLVADLKLSLEDCFEKVALIPGESIHLIASNGQVPLSRIGNLPQELIRRKVDSRFITEAVLNNRVMPFKISQLEQIIDSIEDKRVSKDDHPIALANAISLWSQQFKSGRLLMGIVNKLGFKHYLVCVPVFAMLMSLWLSPESISKTVGFNGSLLLFNVGFTSLFCQVLLLFCYQVTSGYIYSRIALIVATFMFGMGCGSVVYFKKAASAEAGLIPKSQAILAAMPPLVIAAFEIAKRHTHGLAISDLVFPISAFLVGATSGYAFRASSGVMSKDGQSAAHIGGHTYSLDLLGASVAGVLTGFVIIPRLGFFGSTLLVLVHNLICFLVMGVLIKVSSLAQSR